MSQGPSDVPNPTASSFEQDIASFARHCRAGNLSPRTTQTYTESARRLAAYLDAQGMPTRVEAIRREHIESFVEDQLRQHKPTTAHNRYRGVQAFFRWALDEGLVEESPMAKMRHASGRFSGNSSSPRKPWPLKGKRFSRGRQMSLGWWRKCSDLNE